MDRELEQLLKDMTSELKDLTRVLRGSAKSAMEGTKTIKQETNVRKMAIKALEDQREDLKKRGKLTKELNKEMRESLKRVSLKQMRIDMVDIVRHIKAHELQEMKATFSL